MTWFLTRRGDLINADNVVEIYDDIDELGAVRAETAEGIFRVLAVDSVDHIIKGLGLGKPVIGQRDLINKKERITP